MIGARVDVRTGWGAEFAREVNQQVAHAVAEASHVGARVASQEASKRRRSGKMDVVAAVEVVGTTQGWEGGFRSAAFYSGMQSRGTVGSRTRSVKKSTLQRRASRSGQARYAKVAGSRGITPLRHEEKGLAAARKRLLELLNRL